MHRGVISSVAPALALHFVQAARTVIQVCAKEKYSSYQVVNKCKISPFGRNDIIVGISAKSSTSDGEFYPATLELP